MTSFRLRGNSTRFLLFQRQLIGTGSIEDVHSRPAVESVTYVRRHSLPVRKHLLIPKLYGIRVVGIECFFDRKLTWHSVPMPVPR